MIFLQFEAPFTSEISQLAMFDSQKVIDSINPHQFPLTWLVDSESTIIFLINPRVTHRLMILHVSHMFL